MESIFAVGIKAPDGTVYSWSAPKRHHDVIGFMREIGVTIQDICNSVQGFITTSGRFVDREEGYKVASTAGQLLDNEEYNGRLFSEQIW